MDLDGDGDLDLYVTNTDGDNFLYQNDGGGIFTKITNRSIVKTGPGSYSVSWADLDNDGDLDLFLGRDTPVPGFFSVSNSTAALPKSAWRLGTVLARHGWIMTTTDTLTCW